MSGGQSAAACRPAWTEGRLLGDAEQVVQLLVSLAVAANEAASSELMLAGALEKVCAFTGWPVGHAFVVESSGELVPTAIWHLDATAADLSGFVEASERLRLSAGLGLPGRVLASGSPAWVSDVGRDGNFPRAGVAGAAGLRGGFAFPVMAGTAVVAVLEFFSTRWVAPDPEFLAVLAHAGSQLGRVFERESAQRSLAQREARFREVLDRAGDAFIGMDARGVITEWNDQAEAVFGWTRVEAVGRRVGDLIIPSDHRAAHERGLARFVATGEARVIGQRLELPAVRRDGQRFPLEITLWAVDGTDGWSFYAFGRDVTERKAAEEALAWRAGHDELTGLPNRTLALDRLTQALARAARSDSTVAVVFVDLDRFKLVNDSFGHNHGDRLLVAVAERLRGCVRESDSVARLAGDEFLVICDPVSSLKDATGLAERIQSALVEPVDVGGERVHVGASIGVALAGPEAAAEELILQADAAMYHAKERGRGRLEVFNQVMRERMSNRLRTARELEGCVEAGELRVHYQPLVNLADRRLAGVEALVRWQHPARGLLLPGEFIPQAEESGMILPIGEWVLATACRQAKSWESRGIHGLEMAVNLSGRQLAQWDLVATVAATLERAELPAGQMQLCLEITESLLVADPDAAAAILKDLRALGVRLAIDDFGTGYSSLAYLRSFPIDVVKIDRSFITTLESDATARAIVQAICDLAHALGLTVVAEGVEEQGQLEVLADMGCDQAQGFLLARPAAPQDLALSVEPCPHSDRWTGVPLPPGGAG